MTHDGSIASTPADAEPEAGGTPEIPPTTTAADVEAWLATGQYKTWASEAAVHAARAPSVHGNDRVYSNGAIAANTLRTDPWPIGAASVKELYASITDTNPQGYAVMVKVEADSDGGANWFFYERQTIGATPVASSRGTNGTLAADVCVSCHAAAGSDPAHTPTEGGRDFVYTPVTAP